jgi:2-oxoglutarate ferredoxin oxidoreductase subunit alpha
VGFSKNPLEDQSLAAYRLIRVPLSTVTRKALESSSITPKEKDRCKNFTALGIMFWLYNRSMETTQRWVETKFKSRPELIEANLLALKGGLEYARATEIFQTTYDVPPAPMAPGVYRSVSGNSALAMGLVAAANRAGVTLFQGSYPITPASDILHELSRYKHFNVITFQAEDEIAAVTSAIGASYAGALGITSTSGPGVALKGEAMGLAVMTELPLVIIDVMRGGPSTGMPTKLEQSDLLMALFGRHGESPLPVIAPATPGDCFWAAFEAARIAIRYMTPVMLLSDGYLANGAEPFKVPDVADLPTVKVSYAPASSNGEPFRPYARDPKTLARPWAKPGTPGLEHRIGGLEKSDGTGNVDYDAQNHERMVRIRADKVSRVLDDLPPTEVFGPDRGDLVVLGWGSTYGAIRGALTRAVDRGLSVAHVHIRHLNPLPRDLGEILSRYRTVLIPELNSGHLLLLVRAKYLIDAVGLSKIQGKPFTVEEILDKVEQLLEAKQS